MKKCIGDKAIFAIEYKLFWVVPTNYFGDIWLWINGERIGEEEADTYLSSCVRNFKEILALKELRRFPGSAEKNSTELFYILYDVFFDDNSLDSEMHLNAGIFRDIFSLGDVGDAGTQDTVKMIIIDEPDADRQRFIWEVYNDKVLKEYFIPYGYFEEVSNAFIKQIEEDVAVWKPAK